MALTGTVQGIRQSGSYLAAQVRPDIEQSLALLKPYRTPITQFLFFSKGAKQIEVTSKLGKHEWYEDELYPYQSTVQAGHDFAGGGATGTLYVTDPTYFVEYSIILLEESSTMARITSTFTGNYCTISSLDGTTLLGAATAGSGIKIITEVVNEYGGVPTALSTEAVGKYNNLCLMTKSVATTGRDEAGRAWTDGESHDEQVEKKIEEMKFNFERAVLLSNNAPVAAQVSTDGSNSYLWTWGEGLIHRISTNTVPYTKGSMTEPQWNKYITQVMEKGSDFRIHYAGTQQITDINSWIGAKVQLKDNVTHEYGVKATRLYPPTGGAVDIVWDPVLDGAYSGYGFTIDPECLALLYMAPDKKGSRKYRIEPNVETPGADGTTTKILMDVGHRLINEERCGILYTA